MDEEKTQKKRGRPKADIQWSAAQRQAQARGKAHSALMIAYFDDAKQLVSEMSTSNLISVLPKLMANKHKMLVPLVCDELIRRVNL